MSGARLDGELKAAAADALQSLEGAVLARDEQERYRALARVFQILAEARVAQSQAVAADDAELAKRLARVGEEKAMVEDALAAARADLEYSARQLEAEQRRAAEMDRLGQEQRHQLRAAQVRVGEMDQELVRKNGQIHELQSQLEALTLRLQRADVAAGSDRSRVDVVEESRRQATLEIERLRAENEQLRRDKDEALERMRAEVATARGEGAAGGVGVLAALWGRLAMAKPPLAVGGATPPVQAAERLVDAFIDLTRFVHELDQSVQPFLAAYTKHNPVIAKPWEVYTKSPDLQTLAREVVDAMHGKPAGVLKMRLAGLKRWISSALIASDSALESISHELEEQFRGPAGFGGDPNRRLKDYVRDDGHQAFHQHIRELRSKKLAEAYAHGV